MATTPNYGWVMPDPTDFVTNLPADFEIFGDAVDADLAGLLGGTTGQVLTKASGTDHDFAFADATSGGMTLISTTSLTGATVTLTSIPQIYKNLHIVIRNYRPVTDNVELRMRFNADSSANRHDTVQWSAVADDRPFPGTFSTLNQNVDNGASTSLITIDFPDYANTTTWKMAQSNSFANFATTPTEHVFYRATHYYNQISGISSLSFFASSGNFTSGDILLYGVS